MCPRQSRQQQQHVSAQLRTHNVFCLNLPVLCLNLPVKP